MKIKHKLLGDYQYTTPDKKIFLIKSGTIIEEYCYKIKNENIIIDKDIVKANPEIFSLVDWKSELLTYIKQNKIPQPAILSKKLIPFIEDMILSSVSQSSDTKLDNSKIKELEEKETELFKEDQNLKRIKAALEAREKGVKDLEDEIEIRLKRLEKKEGDSKNDLEILEKKELELREKSRELIDKNLELDDKLQDIRELERNINLSSLKSSEEIDLKYKELQSKMDSDLKKLSEGEKDLELKLKEISKREKAIEKVEEEWNKKWNSIKEKEEQLELFQGDLLRLNSEIQNWENLHWKFKRNIVPPSAISETMNPNISFN
jgi:DNA repair exonuclease SbcCD ATPase subunit